MKIVYKIKAVRKKENLTLRELSHLSGVSVSQISDAENGYKCLTVTKLCKIAKALKKHETELYEKIEENYWHLLVKVL